MSPAVRPEEDSVRQFIYGRLLHDSRFRAVIAVSVQKYASDFSATVWLGQKPEPNLRQVVYDIETELRGEGISCSILLKTDEELPFGARYELKTDKGDFRLRYYRVDAVKDEDMVFVFSLQQGRNTYRFRVSMSGTLSSMLRNRASLDENKVLQVYLDEIKRRIETEKVVPDQVEEIMFDSRHVDIFER